MQKQWLTRHLYTWNSEKRGVEYELCRLHMLKPSFKKKKMEIKRCQRKLHTWQRCRISLGFCWAAAHGANIGRALRDPDPMHSLACKEASFVFLASEQRGAETLSGTGCKRMLLSAPSLMRTALASAGPLEGFLPGFRQRELRPG